MPRRRVRWAAGIEERGGTALGIAVDVSDEASTRAMADQVGDRFGTAHVAREQRRDLPLDEARSRQMSVDIDYWRRVFSVNLDGALLCTQALAPMMVEQGWGRVVNQTSTGAYLGNGGHYGCSKLALIGLTPGLRQGARSPRHHRERDRAGSDRDRGDEEDAAGGRDRGG